MESRDAAKKKFFANVAVPPAPVSSQRPLAPRLRVSRQYHLSANYKGDNEILHSSGIYLRPEESLRKPQLEDCR